MLKIHETTSGAGALEAVFLSFESFESFEPERVLSIVARGETLPLPEGALDAVMARFGRPVESTERLEPVASLDLGDGRALRHVRHLARFDVIARDYLLYEAPPAEPLCAMATTVAGALEHLARAAAARGPG